MTAPIPKEARIRRRPQRRGGDVEMERGAPTLLTYDEAGFDLGCSGRTFLAPVA